jgi:RHS repeat-associated protein
MPLTVPLNTNTGKAYNRFHSYPFGLEMKGICDKAVNKLATLEKYNGGNELDEVSTMYETYYRGYDQQIGRFRGVDIQAEGSAFISTYQFGFNNPISSNDPLGNHPRTMGWSDYQEASAQLPVFNWGDYTTGAGFRNRNENGSGGSSVDKDLANMEAATHDENGDPNGITKSTGSITFTGSNYAQAAWNALVQNNFNLKTNKNGDIGFWEFDNYSTPKDPNQRERLDEITFSGKFVTFSNLLSKIQNLNTSLSLMEFGEFDSYGHTISTILNNPKVDVWNSGLGDKLWYRSYQGNRSGKDGLVGYDQTISDGVPDGLSINILFINLNFSSGSLTAGLGAFGTEYHSGFSWEDGIGLTAGWSHQAKDGTLGGADGTYTPGVISGELVLSTFLSPLAGSYSIAHYLGF